MGEDNVVDYCAICPANSFSTHANARSCTSCGSGSITNGPGQTNSRACTNPLVNFVLGFLCVPLIGLVPLPYIYNGRVHRIAFQRKELLVKKTMVLFNVLQQLVESALQRAAVFNAERLVRFTAIKEKEFQNRSEEKTLVYETLKFIGYLFLCVVALVVGIVVSVEAALARVLFTAMIMYRGYEHTVLCVEISH
jgi:hypothetical protein